MSLAVSCFAIFSAFYPTLQQKPILILVVDDIRLKYRAFDLAVLGNQVLTLFSR
jgi:hypothetical protein